MRREDSKILNDPIILTQEICKELGCTTQQALDIIRSVNRKLIRSKKIIVHYGIPVVYFKSFLGSEEYANLQSKWSKKV